MGADALAPTPVKPLIASLLPVSVVAAGVILLFAGEIWAALFPSPRTWSAQQQQRLVELSNQATDLKRQLNVAEARPSIFAGENPAELLDRFRKVDAQYNQLYQEFAIATALPTGAPQPVRWAGIVLIVLGAMIAYIQRRIRSKNSDVTHAGS